MKRDLRVFAVPIALVLFLLVTSAAFALYVYYTPWHYAYWGGYWKKTHTYYGNNWPSSVYLSDVVQHIDNTSGFWSVKCGYSEVIDGQQHEWRWINFDMDVPVGQYKRFTFTLGHTTYTKNPLGYVYTAAESSAHGTCQGFAGTWEVRFFQDGSITHYWLE